MTRIPGIRRLFRSGDRALGAEIDDEIRFHVESRVAELVAAGVAPDEARRRAVAEFGDVVAARGDLVAIDRRRLARARRRGWWQGMGQDVRHAARGLLRRPGFTLVTVLTLAVGIGANVAIYAVVDAVLVRPLPFAAPQRLVHLWEVRENGVTDRSEASYPDYVDWVAQSRAFAALGGYQRARFVVGGGDRPDAVVGGRATAGFFDALGVRPVLGRGFASGEDRLGPAGAAVISWGFWQRRFGGRPDAIGAPLTLDGRPVPVVGVLPPSFHFSAANDPDVWIPIDDHTPSREARGSHWLNVVARLAPGVSLAQARADMSAIMRRLAAEYPETNADRDAELVPLREELVGKLRPTLLVLYAAVGLVALVACANVANLLLVRGAGRSRELAIRAAIGADVARVVRLLLVEAGLLGASGCAVGLALAPLALRALLAPIPDLRLRAMSLRGATAIDARVMLYSIAISAVAMLLFGLGPALGVARRGLRGLLDEGQRGSSARSRVRDGLVVAEVALTLVLVSATLLLTRSMANLLAIDPGFDPKGVLTFRVSLSPVAYPEPASARTVYDRLAERVSALPGVEEVGLTTKLPLDFGNSSGYQVVGQPAPLPDREPTASVRTVSAGYFRALGIELIRGRAFAATDVAGGAAVVIVNRALERDRFGSGSALGQALELSKQGTATIVGVVGDAAIGSIGDRVPPTIYDFVAQDPQRTLNVAVRAAGDPQRLVAPVRAILRDVDPTAPMMEVHTMEALVWSSPSVFARRYPMLLIGAFGAVALALAVIGIYGVVAYSIAQRTRELGIRVALGATRAAILRMVLGHGVRLALGGALLGVPLALFLTRAIASLLYGVTTTDPGPYAAVALLLVGVAALASWVPAYRAVRVDPTEALRAD